MPQTLAYQIRVNMQGGRSFQTIPIHTQVPDDHTLEQCEPTLTQMMLREWHTCRETNAPLEVGPCIGDAGVILANPGMVETFQILVLDLTPNTAVPPAETTEGTNPLQ